MRQAPAPARRIDALTAALGKGVRWLALAMVIATVAIVLLRYGFGVGAIMLQESVMYMHGVLFLIGISYGISRDTHVRVDLLYSRLAPTQRSIIDLLGHVLFLMPVAGFILYTSLPYTLASWRVLEGSSEVGGVPAVFLLKSLIPVAAALILLQGISEILKRVSDLTRR